MNIVSRSVFFTVVHGFFDRTEGRGCETLGLTRMQIGRSTYECNRQMLYVVQSGTELYVQRQAVVYVVKRRCCALFQPTNHAFIMKILAENNEKGRGLIAILFICTCEKRPTFIYKNEPYLATQSNKYFASLRRRNKLSSLPTHHMEITM